MSKEEIYNNYSEEEIKGWLKPENYLGLAESLTEQTCDYVQCYLSQTTSSIAEKVN